MHTKKRAALITNLILIAWFFLDMIGIKFGDKYLVESAYQDDGIFFLIFLFSIFMFWKFEKTGKYILDIWLIMWFITQFMSHWLYTIKGPWDSKKQYFSNTINLFSETEAYIPDLYHMILHLLIILSFAITTKYIINLKKNKTTENRNV